MGALPLQPASTVLAQNQSSTVQVEEPYAGQPICQPDVYLETPSNCLPLGPSSYLTNLAQAGLYLPVKPLPTLATDSNLSQMDQSYLVVTKNAIPLYDTLNDAEANKTNSSLGAGLKYLVKKERENVDNKIFYKIGNGKWINADEADAKCCIDRGSFQGLTFSKTPDNSFGWIVDNAKSRTGPGYSYPETKNLYYPETVVQIFSTKDANSTIWYMIGQQEWVERRYIRPLDINPTPPSGVTDQRWIEVNLYNQTLSVYEKGQLVFATLIASGMKPFYTRPGLFQIQTKNLVSDMWGSFEADRSDYYYIEEVPWTMYYDEDRALHGAYWRTLYGYPQSHGCVNLAPGDAHWLYDWAVVGDWVYVWDPSGQTPVDSSAYGQGGA